MIDKTTTFVIHRRMIVVYMPHRDPAYFLYRRSDTVEIGQAATLFGIIEIADSYNDSMGA